MHRNLLKSAAFALVCLGFTLSPSGSGVMAQVSFSRTITAIGAGDSFDLELEGSNGNNCKSEDEYGVNDCTFDWGETITGSFAGVLDAPLNAGSTFSVDLKVDRVISWKFSCPACGGNCSTTVPVVKAPVNFAMPPCPIAAGAVEQAIETILPDPSPLNGATVSAKGTVGVNDESGGTVLAMTLDITAK